MNAVVVTPRKLAVRLLRLREMTEYWGTQRLIAFVAGDIRQLNDATRCQRAILQEAKVVRDMLRSVRAA